MLYIYSKGDIIEGGDRERSDASCRYVRMYAMYVCPDQVVRATAARGLSFLIILAVNVIVICIYVYTRSDQIRLREAGTLQRGYFLL